MRRICGFILVCVAAAYARHSADLPATLILRNAKIWTVDSRQPEAQAIYEKGK